MNTVNPIKIKLASGQPVIGIWSIISSPALVEIFALAGLDFVILDMEHGVYDVAALDACVRACEGGGAAPLVRVPGVNSSAIQWALDSGAYGVIVPQVSSAEQVAESVAMSKFSPEGYRGYNPFTRAGNYGAAGSSVTGKLSNSFGLTSVIVENESSLAQLDAICAVPGLDLVYVGVYDLSIALGCNGNIDDPKIVEVLREAITTIRSAGKAAGMMVRSSDEISKSLALGANFLVYGVDTNLIRKAVFDAVESINTKKI